MRSSRNAIQQRQMDLLQHLQRNGSATVTDLSEILSVSPATIRRDLESLRQHKQVSRYFGGAKTAANIREDDEPSYMATITQHLDLKRAIARRAAQMLEDGDTVFINSSATALLIYPYITKNVLIITNNGRSLSVNRPANVNLILTGGEVYGDKQSLTGYLAVEMLSRVAATKCILGVSGISVEGGITSRVIQETTINRTMLNRCTGSKIIVADHTKIGIEHNFFFSSITDITHLITDNQASDEKLAPIRRMGINVTVTEPFAE